MNTILIRCISAALFSTSLIAAESNNTTTTTTVTTVTQAAGTPVSVPKPAEAQVKQPIPTKITPPAPKSETATAAKTKVSAPAAAPAEPTAKTPVAQIVATKSVAARPPASKPKANRYVVRAGDTLSEIAAAFRISTEQLRLWNRLTNANHLLVGQTLLIPPTAAVPRAIKHAPANTDVAAKPAPEPQSKAAEVPAGTAEIAGQDVTIGVGVKRK